MAGKSFSVKRVGEFISGDVDAPAELQEASAAALGYVQNTSRTLFRTIGREVTLRTRKVGETRVTRIFVKPPLDCALMATDAYKELKGAHEAIRKSFPEGTIGALSVGREDK